jgi:hypothetical protein
MSPQYVDETKSDVLVTLHDCKDCGSRPAIMVYDTYVAKQYYITCPNKKCRIRQSTPEGRLEDVAKMWNRNHKKKGE